MIEESTALAEGKFLLADACEAAGIRMPETFRKAVQHGHYPCPPISLPGRRLRYEIPDIVAMAVFEFYMTKNRGAAMAGSVAAAVRELMIKDPQAETAVLGCDTFGHYHLLSVPKGYRLNPAKPDFWKKAQALMPYAEGQTDQLLIFDVLTIRLVEWRELVMGRLLEVVGRRLAGV